jgi:hypothetical protein
VIMLPIAFGYCQLALDRLSLSRNNRTFDAELKLALHSHPPRAIPRPAPVGKRPILARRVESARRSRGQRHCLCVQRDQWSLPPAGRVE